jgi:hypothetical protein
MALLNVVENDWCTVIAMPVLVSTAGLAQDAEEVIMHLITSPLARAVLV